MLRNFLRCQDALAQELEADQAARWNHPEWWIAQLKAQYPDGWEALLQAANRHPPLTLRVNQRRIAVEDYLQQLAACGMAARHLGGAALMLEKPVGVDKLPGFRDGLVSVQDWSAQQAAPLLDVADGMRVLDACAAPGGKTGHLLERADLELTALDSDALRLDRVRANLDRLGLTACVLQGDASRPLDWWDGVPFDRVLLDAPCSGSGVVRRHPDIKWLRRPTDLASFGAQQQALLDALWQVLGRDGKLLYATCSIFRQENRNPISAFLARHGDAIQLCFDQPATTNGQIIPDDLRDGFFYALLKKG